MTVTTDSPSAPPADNNSASAAPATAATSAVSTIRRPLRAAVITTPTTNTARATRRVPTTSRLTSQWGSALNPASRLEAKVTSVSPNNHSTSTTTSRVTAATTVRKMSEGERTTV